MTSIRDRIRAAHLPLVGITGRKGTGKSTFAAELRAAAANPVGLAFAGALREVSQAVFGSAYATADEKLAVDAFWQERLGDDWSTGRKILQRLGTEVFRQHVHTDIWLWVMERRLLSLLDEPPSLITIDDVRFDNEAAFVRELGGTVIEVCRPGTLGALDGHASEAGVNPDLVDITAECQDLDELGRFARAFLHCWREKRRSA